MLGILTQVDLTLAKRVAEGLGLDVPSGPEKPVNHGVPADADQQRYEPKIVKSTLKSSAALSMKDTLKNTIKSRKIAILATDGVNGAQLDSYKKVLESAGAMTKIIATHDGHIKDNKGKSVKVDFTFLTTASVLFDAVYIPGGKKSVEALTAEADAIHFVEEAFRHCKAIAANGEGVQFIELSKIPLKADKATLNGLLLDKTAKDFEKAIQQHRFWEREKPGKIPA